VETPTTEFAAATRQRRAGLVAREPVADAQPVVPPVTAYVPSLYDGPTNFTSGRGLY